MILEFCAPVHRTNPLFLRGACPNSALNLLIAVSKNEQTPVFAASMILTADGETRMTEPK
jgi:hypothetical protein